MRRILLTVSYDGTAYCGWQVQPNGDTIEAQLNRHLSELLQEPIRVIGASRTDSGVHAKGNRAVFDTASRMNAERISFAMNTRLPEDIKIQRSQEVPMDFHPRYQNTIKTYEYRICNRTFPDPCDRLYSLFYHWKLDEEKMQRAADQLTGTHDFTSFSTFKPEIKSCVRTIYRLSVIRTGDIITVRITGNGFLYNMVRIIVGTLLRVGSGMLPAEQMAGILESRDRSAAAETAPAHGLTLVEIRYPDFEEENPDFSGISG